MKEFYNTETLTCIEIPTRCFSCNRVIGNMFYKWLEEEKKIPKETNPREIDVIIMENS